MHDKLHVTCSTCLLSSGFKCSIWKLSFILSWEYMYVLAWSIILKQEISHLSLHPLEALRCFKNVGIFVLKEMLINEHTCLYMCFSPLFSDVYSKRMEILFYSVSFCPLKSKINSFLRIQFSPAFVALQRKKYNFLFSHKLYKSSWVLPVDIFLIFWLFIHWT